MSDDIGEENSENPIVARSYSKNAQLCFGITPKSNGPFENLGETSSKSMFTPSDRDFTPPMADSRSN
jgi:hypothetical protein